MTWDPAEGDTHSISLNAEGPPKDWTWDLNLLPGNQDCEWCMRARGVSETKAMKVINDLLARGYERDLSIEVDEVGGNADVKLPCEDFVPAFEDPKTSKHQASLF